MDDKIVCSFCKKKSPTWISMVDDSIYCDDCVPRGCSCNDGRKDEQGKDYPCCEYEYDENLVEFLTEIKKQETFCKEFEKELLLHSQNNEIIDTLSFLFHKMEDDFIKGNIDKWDMFLEIVNVMTLDTQILVGLLTMTFPIKHKLFFRETFYNRVEDKLSKLYSIEEMKQILTGLK